MNVVSCHFIDAIDFSDCLVPNASTSPCAASFFCYSKPITSTFSLQTGHTVTLSMCSRLANMDESIRGIYQLLSRLILFFFPLGITWISYVGIYWKMMRAKRQVDFASFQSSQSLFFGCLLRFGSVDLQLLVNIEISVLNGPKFVC